jgi:hypothetical protein
MPQFEDVTELALYINTITHGEESSYTEIIVSSM